MKDSKWFYLNYIALIDCFLTKQLLLSKSSIITLWRLKVERICCFLSCLGESLKLSILCIFVVFVNLFLGTIFYNFFCLYFSDIRTGILFGFIFLMSSHINLIGCIFKHEIFVIKSCHSSWFHILNEFHISI